MTRVWIEKKGEEVEALAPRTLKDTQGEPPPPMGSPPKSERVVESEEPSPRPPSWVSLPTWVSYGPPPPRTKQSDTGTRFLRKNTKVISSLVPLTSEMVRAQGNDNMRRGNTAVLPFRKLLTGPSSIDDKLAFLSDFTRMQMMKRKKKQGVEEQFPKTRQQSIFSLRKILMENTTSELQNAVFHEVRNLCTMQHVPQRPRAPRGGS